MNALVNVDFKINLRNEIFKSLNYKNLLTNDLKRKVNKTIYNY